ncbi:glutamine amidotransferase [Marinomonas sp. THO17]|uniref:glutamine amidotransferase-related protein n=1 Tax=Marinomonas sp. THO17 TaxID=3149048 RepID=UPI00336BD262
MKIGILAAGNTPESLQDRYPAYAQMFIEQISDIDPQLEFEVFDVRLNEFPKDCQVCDAWLITGSRADAYSDEEWILNLCDLIRDIDQHGQTLVGICFGHQVIARALGGKVEKYSAGWGVGIHHYQLSEHVSLPHNLSAKEVAICAFHQDQVVEKPNKMQTFLSSEFCQHAGLIFQDQILTFQAHPEFSKAYETELVKLYDGITLSAEVVSKAHQSIANYTLDSEHLMAWITDFLKADKRASKSS